MVWVVWEGRSAAEDLARSRKGSRAEWRTGVNLFSELVSLGGGDDDVVLGPGVGMGSAP